MNISTIPASGKPRELQPVLQEGQTFKMIGLGGVGGIVARYGTIFLAALADSLACNIRIVLVDGDAFEAANATRMLFSQPGNKAAVLRAELLPHFTSSRIRLEAIEQYVCEDNVSMLVQPSDTVLLMLDNHFTRKLVSDYCSGDGQWPGLDDICLISGGNDAAGPDSSGRVRRGTFGNCQVHLRRGGREILPSLTRRHPEIAEPKDKHPDAKDCVEALESSPQNLFANLMAASCILNTLWLHLCGGSALHYDELVFDIAEGLVRPVPRPARAPARSPEAAAPA